MSKESIHSSSSGLKHADSGKFSPDERAAIERTVWRKMDFYLLPVVCMFYLLSWLDRTNLGNARVAGLQKDLKMTNYQYSVALTVTFVPYIASEIPSNLLLKIVGPNYLLPALLIAWGIITTCQGFVTTYGGLLVCRFFIGLFEGGVLPGLVLYLSMFYPRRKLQTRISAFFSTASLAGAFSGLLATGIVKLNGRGGKAAWAWIFILEGAFTVLFGFISTMTFPRDPNHARFLSSQQKAYVISELKADGSLAKDVEADKFEKQDVFKTFSRPHFWTLALVYFTNGTIIYSLAYFTPSILQGLGYSPIRTQLFSVPPYAAAFVVTNVVSYLGDKYRCRGVAAIFSSVCCVIGTAVYLGSTAGSVLYGSLFFTIIGINCSSPALGAWVANNFAPHVTRATSIAALSMITNSGGILSTWLMASWSAPPRYRIGTTVLLLFSVLMTVSCAGTLYLLWTANKQKAEARENRTHTEEDEKAGDRSPWYPYIL